MKFLRISEEDHISIICLEGYYLLGQFDPISMFIYK